MSSVPFHSFGKTTDLDISRGCKYTCLKKECLKIHKLISVSFSLSYFKSISYFLTFFLAGSCSFWVFIWPKEGRRASSCLFSWCQPCSVLETECLISTWQAASNCLYLEKHRNTWLHRLRSPLFPSIENAGISFLGTKTLWKGETTAINSQVKSPKGKKCTFRVNSEDRRSHVIIMFVYCCRQHNQRTVVFWNGLTGRIDSLE